MKKEQARLIKFYVALLVGMALIPVAVWRIDPLSGALALFGCIGFFYAIVTGLLLVLGKLDE